MMVSDYMISFIGGNAVLIAQWVNALAGNSFFLIALSGLSFVTFAVSLVILPLIIARIPGDYFLETTPGFLQTLPLLPRICLLVIKNMAGVVLMATGIIMLFIPGQGLLTIIVGVALMNFPGKKRLELMLLRMRKIRRVLNWIRKKKGVREFMFP